ncbi:hypothetical protein [Taklimakanibacter deserti]|uniref:hypothetical protein n=1 Tax=Taklimakanibacter deserti TaxID=2267839 RepID=UPI0013C4C53A
MDRSTRSSSVSRLSASVSQRRAMPLKLRFSSGDPTLSAKALAAAAAFLSSLAVWFMPHQRSGGQEGSVHLIQMRNAVSERFRDSIPAQKTALIGGTIGAFATCPFRRSCRESDEIVERKPDYSTGRAFLRLAGAGFA